MRKISFNFLTQQKTKLKHPSSFFISHIARANIFAQLISKFVVRKIQNSFSQAILTKCQQTLIAVIAKVDEIRLDIPLTPRLICVAAIVQILRRKSYE
jgi:hypothetical protein